MSSSKKIFRPTIIGGRRTVRKDLVMAKMTLTDLSQEYFISNDYSSLAHKTKLDYEYYIRVLQVQKPEKHMRHGYNGGLSWLITFVLFQEKCIPLVWRWDMQKQIHLQHSNVNRSSPGMLFGHGIR